MSQAPMSLADLYRALRKLLGDDGDFSISLSLTNADSGGARLSWSARVGAGLGFWDKTAENLLRQIEQAVVPIESIVSTAGITTGGGQMETSEKP